MREKKPIVQWGTQVPPAKPEPEEARDANHGILDPAEAGHRLPEGLERARKGAMNKDTGRAPKRAAKQR
jgi:hypothetical protein